MNNNNRNNNNGNNNDGNNDNPWAWAGAAAVGVSALAGGLYWIMSDSAKKEPTNQQAHNVTNQRASSMSYQSSSSMSHNTRDPGYNDTSSFASNLSYMLERLSLPRDSESALSSEARRGLERVPENPVITNLNSLLHDIYIRYIALKADDFELHYKVFNIIFQKLHQTMKEVDPYYKKYSSTVQFAGSHYDRLRIKKPDEFDMDIIIGLPLNFKHDPYHPEASDIVIEPKTAGFLQLKMGIQFQKLPMRDRYEWEINKAAYEWKDSSNYLLRSKFLNWFKSVVIRALNKFDTDFLSRPTHDVDGTTYTIKTSESGPAVTLIIENRFSDFKLDVDLVPALKFPEDRWPIGNFYRQIPSNCRKDVWMVVGKPNKAACDQVDSLRSWRIALHNQERVLMHDSYNLRQAMKFLKKLRDAQGMDEIASYYIKTLFFWEIIERNDNYYWSANNPATILKMMAKRFHGAMISGNIPYFWNKNNNLIANVPRRKLNIYANKVQEFITVLEEPYLYKEVAKYLLTDQEYKEYRKFL